jgi:hypothetical protein
MGSDSTISTAIQCPQCGKRGIATWRASEQADDADFHGIVTQLSDGFRENGRDAQTGDTQILCSDCNTAVPG